MKYTWLYLTLCLLSPAITVLGQSTPRDSTQLLKDQERVGKISGQLARNREKLVQLEKEYAQKTADKQKAIQQAEASANENRNAAEELSNDAGNASKARQAEKQASRARRDTRSIQRADKNLRRLEKNINKLKSQIANDEKALKDFQYIPASVPRNTTDSLPTDSLPADSSHSH